MFEHRTDDQVKASCYLISPASIHTEKDAAYWGKAAQRGIEAAEAMIAALKQYRMDLYSRVQELATAPYHHEIHLTREKRWHDSKVKYRLTLYKVFESPSIRPLDLEATEYPGTERRQAIKDFEAYQKAHPGIIAVKSIEKANWER